MSITKLPYKDHYTDFFSLEVYLESLGRKERENSITEFNEESIKSLLSKIISDLKTHALKIIEGKTWLSGYYPKWS